MIFGTDGIRAEAGTHPLDAETIRKLSFVLRAKFPPDTRVVCGRDTRASGKTVQSWICHCLDGWDVLDLGVVPTPVVAYETKAQKAQLGVMVTASHNPFQYNGLKFFNDRGLKVSPTTAKAWSDEVECLDELPQASVVNRFPTTPDSYGKLILDHFRPADFSGLRIAMDCAHGACFQLVPQLARQLKLDVQFLGIDPNGSNINNSVGSLHPKPLADRVIDNGLDAGFAFDGDGDRLVVVDRRGRTVNGDVLLFAMKMCYGEENLVLRDLVGTIMCGYGLEQVLLREGITLHRTPVGDQNVLALMQANGFLLGGEPSGHLIQADFFPAGDGFLAALRLAKHLALRPHLLEQAQESVPVLPAYENAYIVRHKPSLDEVAPVAQCYQELERLLSGNGRIVFRYSGTEPKLRLWVESEQMEKVKNPIEDLEGAIKEVLM